MRIYSIDDARAAICNVLRELIAVKRSRLNASLKAAVSSISKETEISASYLKRAHEGSDDFAPHLHYMARLRYALEQEYERWEERSRRNRAELEELRGDVLGGSCGRHRTQDDRDLVPESSDLVRGA